MGEVGDQGPKFHAEALAHATEKNIEKVFVTGVELTLVATKFDDVKVHAQMTDLQAAVLAALPGVSSVLVKGSRFMKMEQVVQAMVAATPESRAAAC